MFGKKQKNTTPNFNYIIKLKGVTRQFGVGEASATALDDIDLKIKSGEFIAIMGPSGCGKTTLLNILGLLDRNWEGEYFLSGNEVGGLSKNQQAKVRNQKIGFIFQNFNIIPRLNIIDNVALPLLYAGVSKTKRLERASQILTKFDLHEREYYMPWQLSGGQIQRVAIARALVNNPDIILADEPTGSLDSRSSHFIMEELAKIHKTGQTIILVTHNPNLISYADRVINMIDGKVDSNINTKQNPAQTIPTPKTLDLTDEADINYLVLLKTINRLITSRQTTDNQQKESKTTDDKFQAFKQSRTEQDKND